MLRHRGGPAVIGGAGADEVLDLEIVDVVIYLAGYRDGIVGQSGLEPSGNAVAFIEARAQDGTERWSRTLDTAGVDTIDAIDVGANDLVAVGRTSAAFPSFANGGQVDAFVTRVPFEAAGAPLLAQLGDDRPQHFVAIAREPNGAIHVAGYDDTFVENSAVTAFENPLTAQLTSGWRSCPSG